MTERKISYATKQVWKRFCAWYGADVVERKFGLQPPTDWAELIDSIDDRLMDRILADTRQKFPTWPPALPEFEQIVIIAKRPQQYAPTMVDQLCTFVLRNRQLTPNQVRMTWAYLHRDGVVSGVVIPADGEHQGYRVMVEDMQLGRAA